MSSLSNGKRVIGRLDTLWREIITGSGATREIDYRMKKLISRLDVVVDKIFIKTVKAHDMLRDCIQLTEQFRAELTKPNNTAFMLLTRLETRIDDLVRKTHEFRVKAG
jgi:hypothetical protein